MTILGVHHAQISIPRGAEGAARAFYCGLLGLKEIEKPDSLKGRGGFWLELGSFQVHAGAEEGVDRAATRAHVAYEVNDLAAWRQKLEATAVKVHDGVPIPDYERFEFRDPFGNRVEFLQRTVGDRASVQLESSRLLLRELAAGDWHSVHEYAQDPEVVKFELWGPNSEQQSQEFVRFAIRQSSKRPRKEFELAAALKDSSKLIGACGLQIRNETHGEGHIGYALRPDQWGKGLGTEVARALVRFGFTTLKLHRIWATCHVDNVASARVLEKAGMRREGHLKKCRRQRDGWRDSYLYAILDDEWAEASKS